MSDNHGNNDNNYVNSVNNDNNDNDGDDENTVIPLAEAILVPTDFEITTENVWPAEVVHEPRNDGNTNTATNSVPIGLDAFPSDLTYKDQGRDAQSILRQAAATATATQNPKNAHLHQEEQQDKEEPRDGSDSLLAPDGLGEWPSTLSYKDLGRDLESVLRVQVKTGHTRAPSSVPVDGLAVENTESANATTQQSNLTRRGCIKWMALSVFVIAVLVAVVTFVVISRSSPDEGPSIDNNNPFDKDTPMDENPFDKDTPMDENPFDKDTPMDENPFDKDTPMDENPFDKDTPFNGTARAMVVLNGTAALMTEDQIDWYQSILLDFWEETLVTPGRPFRQGWTVTVKEQRFVLSPVSLVTRLEVDVPFEADDNGTKAGLVESELQAFLNNYQEVVLSRLVDADERALYSYFGAVSNLIAHPATTTMSELNASATIPPSESFTEYFQLREAVVAYTHDPQNPNTLVAKRFGYPIGKWNVSQVTHMVDMFNGVYPLPGLVPLVTSFNQPLGDWDVSQVTDMRLMFNGASSFNQPLGDWNVSQVTDMRGMFWNASAFNQPLGDWNVSRVTDMGVMFNGATSFDQDLCSWRPSPEISIRVLEMFVSTSCPIRSSPALISTPPGPFCHACTEG